MSQVEGHLTYHQDQLPPLLQSNVRRAHQKISADSRGNGRHGVYRTRSDHHGIDRVTSACDRSAQVFERVKPICELLPFGSADAQFNPACPLACPCEHEVCLDASSGAELLE